MKLNAGKLNKRISILEYREIENEVCGIEQELPEVKKLWAFKKDLDKGYEYLESQRAVQSLVTKFIVRSSNWITQDNLIKYKDKIYNIKDVIEDGAYTIIFTYVKKVGIEKKDEGDYYD